MAGKYKGPPHGVPLGLKDLIYTKVVRTTMASASFEGFLPQHDAMGGGGSGRRER